LIYRWKSKGIGEDLSNGFQRFHANCGGTTTTTTTRMTSLSPQSTSTGTTPIVTDRKETYSLRKTYY